MYVLQLGEVFETSSLGMKRNDAGRELHTNPM